jgi:predicted RNase H-like HicB family nuclease
MTTYIALIRKDSDSDFGVDFPDFPGCVTAGKTLEDARRMADEAIGLHVKGMIEDHEPIPEPSTLDAIMADPDNRSAVAFLVEVASKPARSIRVNVMLPEDLLQEIDRAAPNRSRFLTDAAWAKIATAIQASAAPPTRMYAGGKRKTTARTSDDRWQEAGIAAAAGSARPTGELKRR